MPVRVRMRKATDRCRMVGDNRCTLALARHVRALRNNIATRTSFQARGNSRHPTHRVRLPSILGRVLPLQANALAFGKREVNAGLFK